MLIDFQKNDLPGEALHTVLRTLRERGPVQPAEFQGMPAHIITGHAALLEAFMDDERFPGHLSYQMSIEQSIGRSFISMPDPEPHRAYRKLATPAFRSRVVASYEQEKLADLAHELIDRIAADPELDLVAEFTARYPYLVITRLLGLPRDHEDEFHHWALSLLLPDKNPDASERAHRAFYQTLKPVVAARRQQPEDDVISELIAAEVDGRRLTDEEIYSHVGLLFPTGGETTHGTLGNLLYAVLREPENWQALKADTSRIPGAVDELLRWESSVAVLPRVSGAEPFEFYGTQVPANSLVLFGIAGANRDPEVFSEPDSFDISRNASETLEFGRGAKTCPGMHLARRNMIVALEVLTERLPGIELIQTGDIQPRGSSLRCPRSLPIRRIN